jgi:hypothetical protein
MRRFLVILALMLFAAALMAPFAVANGALSACEHSKNKPSFCATGEEPRQGFPKKIEF